MSCDVLTSSCMDSTSDTMHPLQVSVPAIRNLVPQ